MAKNKATTSFVLLLILSLTFSCIQSVKCEVIQVGNSAVTAELIVNSPTANRTYAWVLPLNLTIKWSTSTQVEWVSTTITLSVDNNPGKQLVGHDKSISMFGNSQVSTTNVLYSLLIPLSKGVHRVTIYVQGQISTPQEEVPFNLTFTPIYFNVDNTIIQPSTLPSISPVPTISISTSSPIELDRNAPRDNLFFTFSVVLVVVIVFAYLIYGWNKKNSDLGKESISLRNVDLA
jgi:hypothetical protein